LVTSYNATFGTLDQYLALFGAALSLSAGGNVIKSRTLQAASSSQTPGPEATGGSPRTGV